MKFRPCIDLHNGQVKQIVGSTLTDATTTTDDTNTAVQENFVTETPSSDYAKRYQQDQLLGGHVIKLGPGNDEAALSALKAYPDGLQIGGGINDTNAQYWLNAGASHVIVTSHVFKNGMVDYEKLRTLVSIVGKERLVLDLSCRKRSVSKEYYVVTDRWQTYTDVAVTEQTLQELGSYCDEFLIHGVDVEGKQCGILQDLVVLLGKYSPVPVTYAGGVRSIEDCDLIRQIGNNRVDVTIGSALDCFGGTLSYKEVVAWHHKQQQEQETKK